MSGSGGGGGYQYQAQATAYIATHILAKRPLNWFNCVSDVPITVAAETDGPGDDIRITLQSNPVIELQAKHGLKKDEKFWEAIVKLSRGLTQDFSLYGVLLTDSTASSTIRNELRKDIIRLGQGREDNLKTITKEVIDRLNREGIPCDLEIFKRLRIVIVDLDDSIRNAKIALEVLSKVLQNPEQEGQAWSVLCNDGLDLITKRGQRNAESLLRLLGGNNIQIASGTNLKQPIEWQQICRSMLDLQIQSPTLNDLMAKDGVCIDPVKLFVPIGLIERKQKQYRRSDVGSAVQASQLLQPIEEEIVQRFDQEEDFFNQVICNPNIPNNARFVVTGEPGAGKTTLLQKTGDRLYEAGMFPIWISLGKRGVPPTYEFLSDVLKKEAQFQNFESTDWNASISALLQTGKVWLLLDGADELTTNGNPLQVIGSRLQEAWSEQVKVVLTCRLNAWDAHALPKFTVFRILEFDYQTPANGHRNQIEAYIHQFFAKEEVDPQLATGLIQQLHTPGKERIRDSVKNPLRLSLLCYIWELGIGELPDTKAELYRLFVDYYYDLHQLKHPEISIDRTERDALNLALGEVAKTALDSEDSRFRLRQSLVESISIMGKVDAKGSLFNKAVQLGWLNYIGTTAKKTYESAYAFFHASFQEYFAALAIEDWDYFLPREHRDRPTRNQKGECIYRIFEPHWRETFLIWLGRKELENRLKNELLWKLYDFEDGCRFSKGYQNLYKQKYLFLLLEDSCCEFPEAEIDEITWITWIDDEDGIVVTSLSDECFEQDCFFEYNFFAPIMPIKERFMEESGYWMHVELHPSDSPLHIFNYADIERTVARKNLKQNTIDVDELKERHRDEICLINQINDIDELLRGLLSKRLPIIHGAFIKRILKLISEDSSVEEAISTMYLSSQSYRSIYPEIVWMLSKASCKKEETIMAIVNLLENNKDIVTQSLVIDSLHLLPFYIIKDPDNLKTLILKLKGCLFSAQENQNYLLSYYRAIIRQVAEYMTYPDFYRAWHSLTPSTNVELSTDDGEAKL